MTRIASGAGTTLKPTNASGSNPTIGTIMPPLDRLSSDLVARQQYTYTLDPKDVRGALRYATSIPWVQETTGRTLPPQVFLNAKRLLQQHGAALRGAGDELTYLGAINRFNLHSRPFLPTDDPLKQSVFQALRLAKYDLDSVTSPRVQSIVAADMILASWKRSLNTTMGGPVGEQVRQVQKAMNDLFAQRKTEFVLALRDYDKAASAYEKNPGKAETTHMRYQQDRLISADKALKDVTEGLAAIVNPPPGDDPPKFDPLFGKFRAD
jgi:hypothetical protein